MGVSGRGKQLCMALRPSSRPDQDHQVIEDFVLQSLVGHTRPHLHFVSFGCEPGSRQLMKTLIQAVGGSYHHNVMDDDVGVVGSGCGLQWVWSVVGVASDYHFRMPSCTGNISRQQL